MKCLGYQCEKYLRLALLLTLSACLSGCDTLPDAVSAQIAKRLPSMLGPADRYDVNVHGNIVDALRGKIDGVDIHGTNVALSPQLHVSDLQAKAGDIHVDMHSHTLSSIRSTDFVIGLNQQNINDYIANTNPSAYRHGVRIGLNMSDITYTNNFGIWGLQTSYTVTGTFRMHSGSDNQMDFQPSKGSVAHIGLPLRLIQMAADRQNPVVDLSSMKFPVLIKSARVDDGVLYLSGAVDMNSVLTAARAVQDVDTTTHG